MSDTEIRMMRYTIEQLSAELQASRQYVSDIKTELDRTRKALEIAVDALNKIDKQLTTGIEMTCQARNALEQITALEQKEQQ